MKKRIFALFLALCALAVTATALSVTVFADYTETYHFDSVTGTLTIGGAFLVHAADVNTVVSTSTLKAVVVKDDVSGITEYSFANHTALVSVSIFGATDILSEAFYGCSNLTSAYFFDNAVFYENDIFMNCSSDLKFYGYTGSTAQTFANNNSITFVPIPLKITGGTLGKDYTYDVAGGVLTVLTPTPLTIENVDKDTATSHRIVVASGISANITLAGVNIENTTAAPFEIEEDSDGNVTITLADGTTNTLKATKATSYNECAALQKEGSGTDIGKLTIKGETLGTGKLIAEAIFGAGIGGEGVPGFSAAVSNITISGGNVTATSVNGAGIGSGWGEDESGSVSNITITGGIVTADSTIGAGIGSGYSSGVSGSVSNISITDGTVTATSTEGGAGIGSGDVGGSASYGSGTASSIKITGGSVKASSIGRAKVEAVTPTDGSNPVYLLTLANPDGKTVTIDGAEFPYTQHSDSDKNLYIYLTGADRIVEIGENTTKWFFKSTSKTFEDAKVALLAKNGTLRGYYADLKTAIDNVEALEDIVKMLGNITLTETLEIKKTITLDLNGFELTNPSAIKAINVDGSISFILKDSSVGKTGKIIGTAGGGDEVGVCCNSTAQFIMYGGTITCSDGFSVDCYDTTVFVIYDGTINGRIRLATGVYMDAQGGTVKGNVVGNGKIINTATTNAIENYTKFLGTVTGSIYDEAYPYTITLTVGGKTQTLPLLRGKSIDPAKFGLTIPTDDTLLGWYLTDASGNTTDKVADLAKFLDDGTTEKAPGTYTIKAKLVSEEINDLDQAIKALETANTNLNNALDGKADASTLTSAIADLNGAISAAQSAAQNYADGKDGALKTTLENAISDARTTLQSAIDALTTRMSSAESKLNQLTTKTDTTADELAQAISDLSALTTALNNAKASLTTADEELDAKITSAQTTLQSAIDALTTRMSSAESKLNQLTTKTDTTADELAQAISDLSALTTALNNAKASLTTADEELDAKITSAQTALQSAIDQVASDLETAKTELNAAIANGDNALDDKITALNTALTAAQVALNATDAANKTELEGKITSAQTTLQSAIDQVASDLETAKTELNAAIASGDSALDDKITALNTALTAAQAALNATDAANKTELEGKITSAQTTLQTAIDKVASDLETAKTELNAAIANGDSALDAKITALNTALTAAQAALNATDAANKTELEGKITSAQTTLQSAIDQVASDLETAKTELNAAIASGDNALDDKITALNTALTAAQAALNATDAAGQAELSKAIADAQSTLQTAIDQVASDLADAKAALEAKNAALESKDTELEAKDAAQQTFIVVVCILSCVSLSGNVAIGTTIFILKRKRMR